MDLSIVEKDSIVFLGLMAIAYKNFDSQYIHPSDQKPTHNNGLNIFAAIIDNCDGEVIGQKQNRIHAECNPMMHAEQLTLHEAIQTLSKKRPRDSEKVSVEGYYRDHLFNDSNSIGNFEKGATIYTTLEPCPFCTSALLVTRMKRIVYIIPDATYGQSFDFLKEKFYKSYDITYGNLQLPEQSDSALITKCNIKRLWLMDYVKNNPKNATLYLDDLKNYLMECYEFFISIVAGDLITEDSIKTKNLKTLDGLQSRIK